MSAEPLPLQCPTCARRYSLSERFCAECETPLVYVGRGEEEPITEPRARALKVRPEYTGGELVKAAWARNQAEAELIQGLLLDQGIPSVERRARGFDVPDFLAAGPREILVPERAAGAARELLSGDELAAPDSNGSPAAARPNRALRLLAGLLIALALGASLTLALFELAS